MNKIEGILNKLENVKESSPGQWTALCPAHSDQHPSLSIKNGDGGRILLKCHAGCRVEDIVKAVGLEVKDLFPNKKYMPNRKPSKPVKQNPQPEPGELKTSWNDLIQKYTNRTPVHDFLEKRGIGRETIDTEIEKKNISFFKYNGQNALAARFCDLDGDKTITTIQYISMTGKPLSNDANKLFKGGTTAGRGFFQAGTDIEKIKIVTLSEAVINAMSIADVMPEICSLAIGGSQLTKKVKELRPFRDQGIKIVSFFDKDPAGFAATQRVAKILGQKVLNVKWDADTPNKYDVNDLLQAGQRDVIIRMIEDATYNPEYGLIGEVKSTREELTKRIEETDDIDRLLGPIARDVAQSGLPATYILILRKSLAKKAGVTVKALEQDAGERKHEGGSSDNSKLDHLKITTQVINRYGIENIIYFGGLIYLWRKKGVWQKVDDQEVKKKIHKVIGDNENINQNVINSILSMLQTKAFLPNHRFDISTDTINCLNGELKWTKEEGWTLITHDRKHYRTSQIPVTYDPKAEAPRFGRFLSEIFIGDEDKILKAALVCEILGYTLLSTCLYEIFILLIGHGANGKSVLMRLVEALVGSENVCGVQPSQLDNKFQRAHLHGKLANVVTEINEVYKIADAQIKALSSGELTTAEYKNKDPFDFHPFATGWFGTNHMPHTQDFSEALFRRAIIIPFNRVFAEKEQDKHLIDKLKKELPGILNMALSGLEQVFLKGGFTRTVECEDAKKRWRLECDQAAQFAEDCCKFDPNFYESSKNIYEKYQRWAEENGLKRKLNRNNLTARMCRLGAEQTRGTGGVRILSGVRLVN
ncbi:MAG: putative DNA primase/helicase [Desulfobacteraceae bacterium Eth-SRB2]|nr:MAG: putative DNA primase/helicase [Desulfobacteraceae bacterium Eth-SRB2]